MLNYQGRIAVNGVNFSGTGQFKFALINTDGSQSFWSNDGTSSAGSQPAAAVSIQVNSGIYNVRLGDATLENMTAVPATVFGNPEVHLRVWFNDGTNGWQQMSPDQRISAVGYAMMANTVQDGAITSAKIANGALGVSQLAQGAVSSGLQSAGLSAVAAGGIIGSMDPNSAALLAAGFVRDPTVLTSDDMWHALPGGDAVAAHTVVWTGTELLIWGGVVPNPDSSGGMAAVLAINRGVRFNPSTGVWTPISLSGAPQARWGHSSVWTGSEMIIWNQAAMSNGRYRPATNTWASMAAISTPGMGLDKHATVWTGSEMIVIGAGAAPGLDPDGDGHTNLFEFMAGLLPTSASSRFSLALEDVPGHPGLRRMVFQPAMSGRTFTLLKSTTLAPGSWQPVPGASATGNNSTLMLTDPAATEERAFYQVRIDLP